VNLSSWCLMSSSHCMPLSEYMHDSTAQPDFIANKEYHCMYLITSKRHHYNAINPYFHQRFLAIHAETCCICELLFQIVVDELLEALPISFIQLIIFSWFDNCISKQWATKLYITFWAFLQYLTFFQFSEIFMEFSHQSFLLNDHNWWGGCEKFLFTLI